MGGRLSSALPLLLAVALLTAGGPPLVWPLAIALVTVASVVSARRAKLSAFASLLWMIAAASPAILWARFSTSELSAALPPTLVFLCVAAARRFFDTPLFGERTDRALVLLAAIALGLGLRSAAYPYIVVALGVALAIDYGGGKQALVTFIRTPRAAAAVSVATCALAVGGALGLPALDRATNERFQSLFSTPLQRTGFSPHVRLGDRGPIAESDEIVLRVTGAETDYLRGAVFDTFDGADWGVSRGRASVARKNAHETSEVRAVVEAVGPSFPNFSPRGFRGLKATPWQPKGPHTFYPSGPPAVSRWTLAPARAAPTDDANDTDLLLPRSLLSKLRPLARAWTPGITGDRQRALALAAHRSKAYTYTLDRGGHASHRSALVDFLFENKTGHCEFFATAFVTLARSIGLPARLVAGYRVVEHNGYGGYAVVRAKHAHAWAEVCVDTEGQPGPCRFETIDPTPPGVPTLATRHPRTAGALFDYVRTRAGALYAFALASPERSLPALAAIVLVALVVRAARSWRNKRAEDPEPRPAPLVRFERALAKSGFIRANTETLESLAARLSAADRSPEALPLGRPVRARYGPGTASERELGDALSTHAR